ncbi:MAG: serine/threonine-protein kinase [Acidobacteriota bacterium]
MKTEQENWDLIQELFHSLSPLPAEERARALEAFPALRERVLELLAADDVAGAGGSGAEQAQAAASVPMIGGYRVVRQLGAGGMGTVWLVEWETSGVVARGALKLLSAQVDSPSLRERFVREQKIIGSLNHPNIPRVYDAGFDEYGRPYLCMEVVDGQRLDDYCDDRKLKVEDRLKLFRQLCGVVEYAHRNLILHLDLKPGNVMVTREGVVKLLDFGTAKLLDQMGGSTTTAPLTPVYASPEQLLARPLTTQSDVYSLGVVLYELLAGETPAGNASIVALVERVVRETEMPGPEKLVSEQAAAERGVTVQQLQARIAGDLSVIVMKCLRREPEQRYPSVRELAEEVTRFLDGRPITARPQTLLYRVQKYAQRNAGAVSVTAVLAVALVGALGYALYEQRQQIVAGRKAQARAQFLLWMFQSTNPIYGGKQGMAWKEVVERTYKHLQQGNTLDDATAANLQSSLGWLSYFDGRPDEGIQMVRASVERARKSGEPGARMGTLNTLGQLELSLGRCAEAQKLFGEGEQIMAAQGKDASAEAWIAFVVGNGQVKENCGKDPKAMLAAMEQAMKRLPEIPDDSIETSMPARLFKGYVWNGYAMALAKAQRFDEARKAINEGLRLAAQETDSNSLQVTLYRALATVEYAQKNVAGAAAALGKGVELMEGYASPFEYLRMKVMWAGRLAETGEKDRAMEIVNATVEETRKQAAEAGEPRWMIFVDAGFASYRAGRCEGVGALMKEADEISGGKMPPQWLGNRMAADGLCLSQMGKKEEARPKVERALAELKAFLPPGSPMLKRLQDALH